MIAKWLLHYLPECSAIGDWNEREGHTHAHTCPHPVWKQRTIESLQSRRSKSCRNVKIFLLFQLSSMNNWCTLQYIHIGLTSQKHNAPLCITVFHFPAVFRGEERRKLAPVDAAPLEDSLFTLTWDAQHSDLEVLRDKDVFRCQSAAVRLGRRLKTAARLSKGQRGRQITGST